jgi:hypothetical protein
MELIEQPHCVLVDGLILYFRDDPADIRGELEAVFDQVMELQRPEFQSESTLDEYAFAFRGDPRKKFSRFLKTTDFGSRGKLELNCSSKERMVPGYFLFMASAPLPGAMNLANFLYFELPLSVDETALTTRFSSAFESDAFFLGYVDRILAVNPRNFPRSGSVAVKALASSDLEAKCSGDTWLNPDYRAALAQSGQVLFDGPNRHVAFSVEICQERLGVLDWEDDFLLHADRGKRALFLHALTADRRRSMSRALAPCIVPLEKPRMFWKEPAWTDWRRRVLGQVSEGGKPEPG